jgi:hypothetical protein
VVILVVVVLIIIGIIRGKKKKINIQKELIQNDKGEFQIIPVKVDVVDSIKLPGNKVEVENNSDEITSFPDERGIRSKKHSKTLSDNLWVTYDKKRSSHHTAARSMIVEPHHRASSVDGLKDSRLITPHHTATRSMIVEPHHRVSSVDGLKDSRLTTPHNTATRSYHHTTTSVDSLKDNRLYLASSQRRQAEMPESFERPYTSNMKLFRSDYYSNNPPVRASTSHGTVRHNYRKSTPDFLSTPSLSQNIKKKASPLNNSSTVRTNFHDPTSSMFRSSQLYQKSDPDKNLDLHKFNPQSRKLLNNNSLENSDEINKPYSADIKKSKTIHHIKKGSNSSVKKELSVDMKSENNEIFEDVNNIEEEEININLQKKDGSKKSLRNKRNKK